MSVLSAVFEPNYIAVAVDFTYPFQIFRRELANLVETCARGQVLLVNVTSDFCGASKSSKAGSENAAQVRALRTRKMSCWSEREWR